MDHPQELRLASFATGYGGLDLAIGRALAPVRTVVAVEIEAYAVANLVQKMEAGCMDPAPIWTDLRTFPGRQFHGLVDIVAAGYPCQPFSLAGRRRGTADPRHLWPVILEHIRSIVPGLVICENVLGHVSLGLREVRASMEGMGYRFDAEVCAAVEVGARHLRRRVFWIAIRPPAADAIRSHLRIEPGVGSRSDRSCAAVAGDDGAPGIAANASDQGSGWWGWRESDAHTDADDRRQQEQQEQHSESKPCEQVPSGDDAERLGDDGRNGAHAHGLGLEGKRTLRERCADVGRSCERPSQPGLGRRSHALANRVDRLRLAGNGVVPAQAEFAIRAILGRMLDPITPGAGVAPR